MILDVKLDSDEMAVTCSGTTIYANADRVVLPGNRKGGIGRESLSELVACLRYVEAIWNIPKEWRSSELRSSDG